MCRSESPQTSPRLCHSSRNTQQDPAQDHLNHFGMEVTKNKANVMEKRIWLIH